MSTKKPQWLKDLDYSIVQQCMHCGMCLPTCPTYDATLREKNSPRGRIALMRAVADGEQEVNKAFADEMYYCLGCLACVTACPAGVDYATLFEAARADIEQAGVLDSPQRNFWRWLALKFIFTRPRLLRAIGRMMRIYQQSGMETAVRRSGLLRLLPQRLRELEPQTPRVEDRFSDERIKEVETPTNKRYSVGLLTGCVQDLAFSSVNRDTADVLLVNGCEVVKPRNQSCCGSLHGHNGAPELAKMLAKRLIDSFPLERLDAIITNAGGCGSHLKHYSKLLGEDPEYAEKAKEWDRKCKDIHEWLEQIGTVELPEMEPGAPLEAVTYHDSCHLCHGQKITEQPRSLLSRLPGVQLRPLKEASWCCGSAGVYNITQPEQSARLLERKIGHLQATGANVIATANPGCHLQIQNGLKKCASSAKVLHPVTVMARAYRKAGLIP